MDAGLTSLVSPRLHVLAEDQKDTLFLAVLDVLERIGVRVDNDEGLELLDGAGARIAGPTAQFRALFDISDPTGPHE